MALSRRGLLNLSWRVVPTLSTVRSFSKQQSCLYLGNCGVIVVRFNTQGCRKLFRVWERCKHLFPGARTIQCVVFGRLHTDTFDKLCGHVQEVLAAGAGGALHLRQGQAAPAAPQLHRRAPGLHDPHQSCSALPAHPLPPVPLLQTTPSCSTGLLTPPGTSHVLSLILTS